ncbi:MAG: hypothetical protein ACOX3W_06860 [Christensenellaceae bacterium]|jgi:hypothetical protein
MDKTLLALNEIIKEMVLQEAILEKIAYGLVAALAAIFFFAHFISGRKKNGALHTFLGCVSQHFYGLFLHSSAYTVEMKWGHPFCSC